MTSRLMAPGARSTMSPAPAPVLLLLLCAARTGSTAAASGPSSRWASQPASQRGAPPYPFPATHADGTAPRYQTRNEKDGQDEHKINVHLVPHTHDDTGWQITVDQYFFNEVYYVVDTVIDQLEKDPKRHFIYVETAFFARWWDEQPDARRAVTKRLVENGQLEFINGGWCMHDEGSPLYTEMVDQTTRGHQFLRKNFGDAAIPRGTWQIDPFGHSNTQAWLLGSEAGFESLYWGRTDYQDLNNRLSYEGQQQNQWPEWVWQGSHSLGKSAELFAGQLTTGGYGAPGILHDWGSVRGNSIDESTSFVQDNPSRHDYNLDAIMDDVISQALKLANTTRGNHQLWPVGSDFQYQNADVWYHNLDKLIHYINVNASKGGPVVAFYSTPSHYTDAKYAMTKRDQIDWESRFDDVMPLANAANSYWSGYFTSRPGLKRQVRMATNFLSAARQMEVASNVTKAEVNLPTTRPSPPVGKSWTDSMEGAIGVATHHDGMSGTERQQVANDYDQRISEGHFEAEAGVSLALSRLAGVKEPINHCNCQSAGDCLNISVCSFTAGADEFTILAWNPQGQNSSSWLRVPVTGSAFTVTDLATGAVLPSQTTALDARTKRLPLLYINKFGMTGEQFAAASHARANNATHSLTFRAPLPAAGYGSFLVKAAAASHAPEAVTIKEADTPHMVTNGIYELGLDHAAGTITTIKNLRSGVSTPFNLSWGHYVSAEGHTTAGDHGQCTKLPNGNVSCSTVSSDHYTFRPAEQRTFAPAATQPTLEVITGALVTEIRQSFSSWATHVIRLTQGVPFIEVEWTAGPIPWNEGQKPLDPEAPNDPEVLSGTRGKELVLKFSSGLQSAARWSADSNGREMVERTRDARGPAYPPLVVSEPVAGNYYPVNSLMSLDDGTNEMAVAIDTSVGGSSMVDGQLELMVHRRLQHAQRGGLNPLNETMCMCNYIGMRQKREPGQALKPGMCPNCPDGDPSLPPVHGCDCEGMTIRGTMGLVFDRIEDAHATRRQVVERLNFAPTLAFTKGTVETPSMSLVSKALPMNVKLMTLTSNYADINDGKLLLRLAHKYQVGEHPLLSQPATFSLAEVFGAVGFRITAATETTLTANQPKESWEAKKKVWPTSTMYANTDVEGAQTQRVALGAADERMTVTIRAMELKTYLVAVA